MAHEKPNRWKGFVLGILGGTVGLMAMPYYFKYVAPTVERMVPEDGAGRGTGDESEARIREESFSLFGRQYREGESSTVAAGRIFYQRMFGKEPQTEETRELLGQLMHWNYGTVVGGVYGALRPSAGILDTGGGLAYGTALWLVSELVVPMLGLGKSPVTFTRREHANRLVMHLAYGMCVAGATQVMLRIFRP